jgi:hypothetical protein
LEAYHNFALTLEARGFLQFTGCRELDNSLIKRSHQGALQIARKERPNMTIMIYKDHVIEATAEQSDDSTGWSVSVRIYAHDGSHSNGKVFKPSVKHINQREAIKHGFILGQHIIDGRVEDCSIEDI